MIRKGLLLLVGLLACLAAGSQPVCRVTDYGEMTGTPKDIMRILQDRQGFIWVASTNGIYRYDGYEWRNFKSHSGDGTRLTANNVRSAYLSRQGNIWCLIDNHAILFDLRTYRFADVLAEYERSTGKQLNITKIRTLDNGTTWFITDDANVLTIDDDDARQVYHVMKGSTDSDTNISADEQGRTWIATPQATYLYSNHKLTKHDNVTGKRDTAPKRVFTQMPDGTGYLYEDAFGTTWQFHKTGGVYYIEKGSSQPRPYYGLDGINPGKSYNRIRDEKGDLWLVTNHKLVRLSFGKRLYQSFPLGQPMQLRCGMKDRKGRLWLSDIEKGYVMLYTPDGQILGYLSPDGTLSASPRTFDSPVYSMLQDSNGNIWLGTRFGGLFRMREASAGKFHAEHFTKGNSGLGGDKLFDIKEDRQGRLWMATDKDGPMCVMYPNGDNPQFLYSGHGLKGFLPSYCHKTYSVLPTNDGHLLVGTSEGLYVADISGKNIGNAKFKEHQREADRKQSISSSYVINLTKTADHRLFAVTQSGGVNEIVSANLMDDHLDFRHYDISTGLPSDLSSNIFEDSNGGLWIVYDDALVKLVADGDAHLYDLYFRNEKLAFTGISLQLEGGRWLLGTKEGAIVADLSQLGQSSSGFVPPIVLANVSIEGQNIDYAPQQTDTVVLNPGQRGVSLDFAALDYDHPQGISYAFRMGDDQPWNNIATGERSILMTNLEPGTYTITVRSTNSDGQWVANEHRVVVIVKPTFWQTGWAKLLIACIIMLVVAAIVYTISYIRRIKRQQHETMEFYLALLNKEEKTEEAEHREEPKAEPAAAVAVSEEDEAFMKRLLTYIEQNIGNSDASLKEMADATATSRSSLHRKTNRLMGTTPMDFLREARMRKACQLLRENGMSVVDVAYTCGYSDPKYFSKCFKQDIGKTPSQYREGI